MARPNRHIQVHRDLIKQCNRKITRAVRSIAKKDCLDAGDIKAIRELLDVCETINLLLEGDLEIQQQKGEDCNTRLRQI